MSEADFDRIKQLFNSLEEREGRLISSEVKTKRVVAFDTETVDGKCVLLAASDGKYIFPQSFEDIAQFLTQRRYTRSLNFFWNIDFDFFAIVKHLPPDLLEVLYENKGIVYDDYFIRWIPKKFFSIERINGKHSAKFFDLWQFYRMSLNEASIKYLNDRKEEVDVRNIQQYLSRPSLKAKLVSYCLKDAELTAKLGALLQEKLNAIGIDFSHPYSCGHVSMRFFFNNKLTFGFKKTEWNLYALLSYYGGRFEIIKRGYFNKIYQFDINSAYPFYISQLTDPATGEWIKSKDLDYNADYGFARIVINGYSDDVLSPIPYRKKDRTVIFPNFEQPCEYYISFPELLEAEKMGLEFDIVDAWMNFNDGQPLFPEIAELYEARKKAKKAGDKVMDLVLKIIMNSLYGKFAEKQVNVTASLTELPNSRAVEIDGRTFYVREICRPGLLFNPVLASYITARTRAQLLHTVRGHEDHIVGFATDSILCDTAFVEQSEQLGGWKLEAEGEALILMSGVYTIKTEKETKTRFRGFPISADFFKLIEENRDRDKFVFEFEKAVKLGEAISFPNVYSLDEINVFRTIEKELTCYSDDKRDWMGQPLTFGDLLVNQFDSVPKTVANEQHWYSHNRRYTGYRKQVFDWQRAIELAEQEWSMERALLLSELEK